MMLSKSVSLVRKAPILSTRTFASKGGSSGSGTRGASEDTTSSTNQTSNAPNYGTSNQSGGRFSGSTNQNIQGASNTTSPSSASKATSTSGTSQATGTGSSAVNKGGKATPQPQDDSSIANNKSANKDNAGSSGSGFTSFFKTAFGGAAGNGQGSTESLDTSSSNPNRVSIPSNEGATYTKDVTGQDANVKASKKDREGTGSVGGPASPSGTPPTASTSSKAATTTGGAQVNRTNVGTSYSLNTNSGPVSAELTRARGEMQFDSVGIRYAYLLWSMYKDKNALNKLDGDLEKFYNFVGEEAELRTVFDTNELMTERNREAALEKFLEKPGRIDEKLEAFLRTVAEMRRLADLEVIFESLHEVRSKIERNVHTAVVASAKPLSASEKEAIRKTIMSTFSPQGTVDIEEEIKPELGGGYEIYYDGKYHLDNTQKSLVTELEDDVDAAISAFITKRSDAEH